jgi:spore maturation protein CgeB
MNQSTYRILFEGERWLGSDAGGCLRALRRLDQAVVDLDFNTFFPPWRSLPLRLCRRLILPLLIQEYNRKLLELAREFKPEIFLAFKGTNVIPATLQEMKRQGIALYNYYPDVSAFTHTVQSLPRALQVYDCVFSTKSFLAADLAEQGFPLQHWELLPNGYDPDAHHPVAVTPDEQARYGADVTFIGLYLPGKAETLAALKRLLPKLDLAIWGNCWHLAAAPELKPCIRGRAVLGIEYLKAISASKILLGLLSEKQKGSSIGDQVTSRSFNLPACGAFMLHNRTEEIRQFYEEGREIECFSSVEELAEKIRYYLANPELRQAIAQAGYRRCVPAYSFEQRLRWLLSWHAAHAKS